jgi:hypothetical protein
VHPPEIETNPALTAPTVAQPLGATSLILLAVTAIGFILVPHAEDIHPSGAWFDIGWPLPTASIKIPPLQLPNHLALQPYFDPTGSFNLLLWLIILLAIPWLARDPRVPAPILQLIRFLIVIATCTSAAWLTYGIFNVTSLLLRH